MLVNGKPTNYRRFSILYISRSGNVHLPEKKLLVWLALRVYLRILQIISNGKPIKVLNDRIDISKSKSHNKPKISSEYVTIKYAELRTIQNCL